jgi:hypothetical protein
MPENPNRPTATWKLWVIGLIGGVGAAIWMFASNDPAEAANTSRNATAIGTNAVKLLLLVAAVGGGWGALRQKQ